MEAKLKKNLRICLIHPFLFRYLRGIERYVVSLSGALQKEGAEVDILTWKYPDPIHWGELPEEVKIRQVPVSKYYSAFSTLLHYPQILLQKKYDKVLVNFADYGEALALNLLLFFGVNQPFDIVLHYPYSQVPHRYHSFVRSGLAKRARNVIGVSRFVADQAVEQFERPCEVISHGVDFRVFKPDLSSRLQIRKELGIPGKTPLIVTAAALEERKGMQWMIRALPKIKKVIPDIFYLVLGDGPYKKDLLGLVDQLGVSESFRLRPSSAEIQKYYQAADLFSILAKGEASSLVGLESLACGIPVIASKHRPFDELINDNWGLRINEEDLNEVSGAVIDLLRDSSRREKMGQRGKDWVAANHSWSSIAKQYLALFKK